MEFADKLNFLFELTQAEGKELAEAMNITPPGISKMRKGLRGLPRNREAAYSIALFFAQRCQSNEKREALSKGMRAAQVLGADNDVLADMLLSWFLNEMPRESPAEKGTEAFLHRLNYSAGTRIPHYMGAGQPLHSAGSNIIAFYGIEGKRAAYMTFWQYLLKKKKAFDVCVLSDEDNTWIDEDPSYAQSYYNELIRLTEQGCFFRRIVGPLTNITQAFYSLNRWFPLYMTGKATSFYFKRMRDDVNRITVFVVAGVAAMYSFSVGVTQDKDCVTFFTTDAQTVNAMSVMYNKYLAICDPATKTFSADTSDVQMYERMLEYESCESTSMQLSPSLSFITLPWGIAVALCAEKEARSKEAFLASFAKRNKAFHKNLDKYDCFDFIRLADVDDVMDGMVDIPAASILSEGTQYYSPVEYLQHLRSIEYLLKQHRHYHVIIETADVEKEPILYIKEHAAVLVARAGCPFVIFDISERNLINAFTEKMRRRLPMNVKEEGFRRETLKTLQACIEQIEERLSSAQEETQ